jgi:hypothetical protein
MILVVPFIENLAEFEGECFVTTTSDVFGYRHCGCSDVTSHAGHRVGVSTKRDGSNDGIHIVGSFEEADDGFGYTLVASGLKLIVWADLVSGSVEVVAEGLFNIGFDLGL